MRGPPFIATPNASKTVEGTMPPSRSLMVGHDPEPVQICTGSFFILEKESVQKLTKIHD